MAIAPPQATPRLTLTGTQDEGFITHYGLPLAELGDEGEHLLALGHPTTRQILAALTAHHRVLGTRILPGEAMDDLLAHGIRRTWATASDAATDDGYTWVIHDASPHMPGAQPVTWIDHAYLDCEDIAVQEQCPRCDRPSRSTTWGLGPGRREGGPHHTCRTCTYRWPAAPALPVTLWKPHRSDPPTGPDECFACHCTTRFRCTDHTQSVPECAGIAEDPIIGHPLCATCRNAFPPDTWRQLAIAGYASPHSRAYPDHEVQRDLWLVLRARNGIAPADATREWQQRLTLTNRRALRPTHATNDTSAR
ncbi:hypothetical protein [Streptomyces buecherae]|uniref:hypothetical protein n=1 Tax=Streptomyces buecherae TaxID=2763006 RepID=UPI00379C9737